MPLKKQIHLPLYEPDPGCGLSNKDVEYEFVGEVPEWITFDEKSRTITAETSDVGLIGLTSNIEMIARYGQLTK